jgi:hypothetical protein
MNTFLNLLHSGSDSYQNSTILLCLTKEFGLFQSTSILCNLQLFSKGVVVIECPLEMNLWFILVNSSRLVQTLTYYI